MNNSSFVVKDRGMWLQKFARAILALLLVLPITAAAFADSASPVKILEVDGRESEEVWLVSGQGRFLFTAEIADTGEERMRGLMFRESMPPTHGMLFDFGEKRRIQMWMRNTPLSLDMIFIDETGKVIRIAERTTPFSDAIIDSGEPVTHVLEINAGTARLIGLKPGDRVEHRLFAP